MSVKRFLHEKAQEYGLDVNTHQSYPPDCWEHTYVGAVLQIYERNGYDDSDFYAIVWDDVKGEIRHVQYATTRGWTYLDGATVDATPEVLDKARACIRVALRKRHELFLRDTLSKAQIGDMVEVVQGRKVRKGTTGRVLSISKYHSGFEPEYLNAFIQNDTGAFSVRLSYLKVVRTPEEFERLVSEGMTAYDCRPPEIEAWRFGL